MFGFKHGRLGSAGTRTLIQRAIASLRARGSDAHLWLPGVGTLNGLTTGNYLESSGNTLATVDNPTGLVLDALGAVGGELSSYAASPQTTSGAISTVLSASLVVGKTYKVSYTARSTGSVQIGVLTGAYGWQSGNPETVASATDVTASFIFVASDTVGRSAIYPVSGTAVATVSVREVSGIHLTQATTASKPLLQQTSGKYSWSFDGSNDHFSAGSFPIQLADDHCVIAGVAHSPNGATQVIFAERNTTNLAPIVGSVYIDASNKPAALWRNQANSSVSIVSTDAISGSAVIAIRQIGQNRDLWVNGVSKGSSTKDIGTSATVNNVSIGAHYLTSTLSDFLASTLGPVLIVKGTVTNTEMLLLKKFVASITPNAPSF